MEKLRLGIIGCGGIAGYHAKALEAMDDIQVTAVADPQKERRDAFAARFSAGSSFENGLQLLDSAKELDAVYICVPPAEHKGIEEAAIARGLHFKVEKPMTLDAAQGDAIAKAVAEKGLVTAVGFQDRYLDVTDRMLELIPKMQVGLVYGSWVGGIPMVPWWRTKATSGGQLVEQNIHILDMLRFFFGEAERVYAQAGRGIVDPARDCPGYNVEDFSTALITFKNGVQASLMSGCYLDKNGTTFNGMVVVGRDRTLRYDLRTSLTVTTRTEETVYKSVLDNCMRSNRAFIDAVRRKDPAAVRSPYSDALKTLKLGLAANKSMETNQAVTL